MDITRDVMRMTEQGKPAAKIRRAIDAKYLPGGKPTRTPPPA